MPSAASCVRIRSSKYSRSSFRQHGAHVRRSESRAAAAAWRSAAADRGARCARTSVDRRRRVAASASTLRQARVCAIASAAMRLAGQDGRASPRAVPTRGGSSTRAGGRKHAERDLRQGRRSRPLGEDEIARQRQLEAAAEAAAAHDRGGRRRAHRAGRRSSACISGSTRPISLGRVLRNAGAEAEVAPRSFDRDQLQVRILRERFRAPARSAPTISAVTMFPFGWNSVNAARRAIGVEARR